jgi:hypothetical protein
MCGCLLFPLGLDMADDKKEDEDEEDDEVWDGGRADPDKSVFCRLKNRDMLDINAMSIVYRTSVIN